jgi:RNA polymerase sigma-70 factor (sigma-E family)
VLRRPRYEGLEVLVAERGQALLATAVLLTGERAGGEDLLQAALERSMRHWSTVRDPEAYVRRAMYRLAVDQWRRRRRHREVPTSHEPEPVPDGSDAVHLRQALIGALRQLPRRQRAALVLRYWEGLSEAEAAEVLGCSIGTVKSTTSRGIARLRELTASWDVEPTAGLMRGATR